jgi:hypothetical protein
MRLVLRIIYWIICEFAHFSKFLIFLLNIPINYEHYLKAEQNLINVSEFAPNNKKLIQLNSISYIPRQTDQKLRFFNLILFFCTFANIKKISAYRIYLL